MSFKRLTFVIVSMLLISCANDSSVLPSLDISYIATEDEIEFGLTAEDLCVEFDNEVDQELAMESARRVAWITSRVYKVTDAPLIAIQNARLETSDCAAHNRLFWDFSTGSHTLNKQATSTVPHEAGHLVLFEIFGHTKAAQYGSDAPDWIDEAFALSFEGLENATRRLPSAKRTVRIMPTLEVFLEAPHPLTEQVLAFPSTRGPQNLMPRPESVYATAAFYSQALLFHEYLVDRSGEVDVLMTIIRDIKEGQSSPGAVMRALKAEDTQSLSDINQDFVEWVNNDAGLVFPRVE